MKFSRLKLELMQAKRGLNNTMLAERAGICRQNLSNIKGRGTCTPVSLQRLADALGCDPAELIEKEG